MRPDHQNVDMQGIDPVSAKRLNLSAVGSGANLLRVRKENDNMRLCGTRFWKNDELRHYVSTCWLLCTV